MSFKERWDDVLFKVIDTGASYVLIPLFILTCVVGLPLLIAGGAGCFGERKEFVCGHTPHMGACAAQTTTWMYSAATKTMQPIISTCGCVSSHGVKVEEAR